MEMSTWHDDRNTGSLVRLQSVLLQYGIFRVCTTFPRTFQNTGTSVDATIIRVLAVTRRCNSPKVSPYLFS